MCTWQTGTDAESLRLLFQSIRNRPGMWFQGSTRFRDLECFMLGHMSAARSPLCGFGSWLAGRVGRESSMGWQGLVALVAGTPRVPSTPEEDELLCTTFFALMDEYLAGVRCS